MRRALVRSLALGLLPLLAGCAQSKSSAIATSEIYGTFYVDGNSADTITCRAIFRVGGPLGTYIELDGADTAACSDGTNEVSLTQTTDFLGIAEYTATGLAYDPGRTYSVIFRRGSAEAHTSTAVLPAAVSNVTPAGGTVVTKGNALNVTWTASATDGMRLELSWQSGGHSRIVSEADGDDGSFTFDGSSTLTQTTEGTAISGDVAATLTLTRSKNGTPTTTLKGAFISGRQALTRNLTLRD